MFEFETHIYFVVCNVNYMGDMGFKVHWFCGVFTPGIRIG
jgi:hypothetical protein